MIAGRPRANAQRVAELVRASGAQLGAVIDPDGEHLTIVDDEGTVLSDDQALLLLLRLVVRGPAPRWRCRWRSAGRPRHICAEAGAAITYTKLSSSHLMEVAARAASPSPPASPGGSSVPGFLPAFDAAATLVELVAMLAETGQPLSKLVQPLPPVHIAHEAV